jgi:nitroreductase/NAD-dependent dihydropyrimidine dehydrogenase PreA subunit
LQGRRISSPALTEEFSPPVRIFQGKQEKEILSMTLITINRDKCKKDGLCIGECPLSLLVPGPENYPETIERADEFCLACGHCIAVCPHDALSLKDIRPDSLAPVSTDRTVDNNALVHLVKTRRSIRHYREQPVPRDMVERLICTAHYAPSAKNDEAVEWLVLDKRESLLELAKIVIDGMRKSEQLQMVVSAFDAGRDIIFRGAPNLVIAHSRTDSFSPLVDCTIALTTFELLASGLGLGTCWAGFLMMSAAQNPAIEKYLAIPEGHKLYGALMLGYPRYHFHRIPVRKKKEITWR